MGTDENWREHPCAYVNLRVGGIIRYTQQCIIFEKKNVLEIFDDNQVNEEHPENRASHFPFFYCFHQTKSRAKPLSS